MIPLPESRPPARDLVSFWNEARLRADQAKSVSVKPAPGIVAWRAALEDVLRVGYGIQTQSRFVAGAWEQVRWRTTPSAGALYPFEVVASVAGQGTYLWDIDRGRLVGCGLPPLTRDDLAGAGFATSPGHRLEALLILVARPWLSMKKYRQRGYAYCHLDVGHTATNLAIYAAAQGFTPTLHLRFSRVFLAEHLELDGLCREPLAVLSFASAAPAAAEKAAASEPTADGRSDAGLEPLRLAPPEQREILNWDSLSGILSYDCCLEPPCAPAGSALLVDPAEVPARPLLPLPNGRVPMSAWEWRWAILGRRSAKGFRDEPLSVAQLGELLGALRPAGLPTDSGGGAARLGMRLVARNVDGLAGVFAYAPRSHALHRLDQRTEDPVPACMQQQIAGGAAALLVFHAPICRLVAQGGYSAFAELHFHAAQLGQRLYLAASRLGTVGITCIGGFDAERCATLARLEGDEEAVYIILLGIPDEAAVKHDRLSVAFSHGYTTREG